MTYINSRVTVDHVRYVAARTNTNVLVDTTNGIALIPADKVLTDSTVIRVLLTKGQLHDTASGRGVTLTELLASSASAIAVEANALRTEGK